MTWALPILGLPRSLPLTPREDGSWGAGPGSEACIPHFLAVRLGKSLGLLSPSPPLCQAEGVRGGCRAAKVIGEAGDLGAPCSLGDLPSLSPSRGLWRQL